MKDLTPLLKDLKIAKRKLQPQLREHRIDCVVGEWLDCAVLKLQKKSWTKGGSGEGVFFSIWAGEKDLKKGRFNYNIHALKLRLWKDHAIKPGEFAEDFRRRFRRSQARWPNVRTDYGPQTLMQGWLEWDPETFEIEALKLANEFLPLHPMIDEMLTARKTNTPSGAATKSATQ